MAFSTTQPAQMTGLNGYDVIPVVTIGETIPTTEGEYIPVGILDGLGAFELDDNTVRVLANHELRSNVGYAYTLANGTALTGARVSYFDIDKQTLEVMDAGLAYDTIINRAGEEVDEVSDLEFGGLNRFCSSMYIDAHQFGEGNGFVDGIYFTGEETFGGTEFALDVATNTLYAVPWLGRAAWENITQLDTGNTEEVAILVGDDREAAPLLLYVGEKDTSADAGFLERNGLTDGKLYAWVPDGEVGDTETENDPDTNPDPAGFNGTGNSLSGRFVEIEHYREDLVFDTDLDGDGIFDAADINSDGVIDATDADVHVDADGDGIFDGIDVDGDGTFDYDNIGFATQTYQDFLVAEVGAFQFSRPEDVATNPEDGTEAVLTSTGRGGRFPDDNWGTTYTVDVDFNDLTADLEILYDGDDAGNGQFSDPDFGLRSPDNVDWADNGNIYINEDRSTSPGSLFGGTSGEEASIWELDPNTGDLTRVAQIDRSGVPGDPIAQTDPSPNDIGNWESSGILDVTELFGRENDLFIFDVQAHSLRDGVIAEENLVQGGQLAFLEEIPEVEVPGVVFGSSDGDFFDSEDPDDKMFVGEEQRLFAGAGDDTVDVTFASGGNRIDLGSGDDYLFGGTDNRILAGSGDDTLFVGSGGGNNVITGGAGMDQFWLVTDSVDLPLEANVITDFAIGEDVMGFGATDLSFEDLDLIQDGSSTVIHALEKDLAMLRNTQASDLSATDFVFA